MGPELLVQGSGTLYISEYMTGAPVQCHEAVIKTTPKKNKYKKANWLSEEDLQRAGERREAKDKGEKERYTHLNAEFQTTARRDKKTFLSDQCKEVEENNGMGKTRELFKKIRDTKGTFHERWAREWTEMVWT